MGGTNYRGSGVGHGGHAGFADQAHVLTNQGWRQQRPGIKLACSLAFFIPIAGQLLQHQRLQRQQQRHLLTNAFEVGPSRFGVFTNPVGQSGRYLYRAQGQAVLQVGLRFAAEIQRRGHQIQPTRHRPVWRRWPVAHTPSTRTPAASSMRQVRISGSPTSALGSSLSIRSSKAMPSPSLLALPAQS